MPIAAWKQQRQESRKATHQRKQAKARSCGGGLLDPAPTPKSSRQIEKEIRRAQKVLQNAPRPTCADIQNLQQVHHDNQMKQALSQPIMLNGQRYYVDEIHQEVSHYEPRTTVRLRPEYRQYLTTNSSLTTYGNYMPISQNGNQIWNTWSGSSIYQDPIQYQTFSNPQIQLTWTGWIRDANQMRAEIESEYNNYQAAHAPPAMTPEQQAAARVAEDQRRHQYALRMAERERVNAVVRQEQDAIMKRAMATFIEVLPEADRKTLAEEKCIYVKSQHGRRYRIKCEKGQSGNVDLLDEHGRRTASFCVHPAYQKNGHLIADPDAWLTQKLYLEHDEDTFIKVANMTYGQRPTRGLIVGGVAAAGGVMRQMALAA
jgi:hypothetical protein